jgi:histidinol dehydrogenase
VQEYTRNGLRKLGPQAIALAEAEGLAGHAESVRVRMR